MTTDLSFARRSLISEEDRYRQSLEYRIFLAENPDMAKNKTLPPQQPQGPSIHDYGSQAQDSYGGIIDYPTLLPENQQLRLAQTFDGGNQQKTLLNRHKQFVEYAPDFNSKLEQISVGPQVASPQKYASTLPTQTSTLKTPSTRDSRWNRWEPKTVGRQNAYEDLNDRDQAFDLDQAMRNEQVAGQGAYQFPARQAVSAVRNNAGPRSQLISSAKLQIGRPAAGTLHNSSVAGLIENPLVGYSEGDRVKRIYQKQFMSYALSQAEGSINDVKERSRSKSRRAKYEAARRRADEDGESASFVDLINRSRATSYANRLARQRSGSPTLRDGSAGLIRHQEGVVEANIQNALDQNATLNDATFQRQGLPLQSTSPLIGQNRLAKLQETVAEGVLQPDVLQREQAKAEYKAQLLEQINEKKQKDRLAKLQEADYEQRMMTDYANYYRIGALRQGGGSPIRDRNGEIVSQHVPFSSQSQQNGGVEQADQTFEERNQNQAQMQSSYVNAFNADRRPEDINRNSMAGTYSPKKQEIMHMKPSNMFEDITEDEFNKREQEKKEYQNLLMSQMNEAKARKQMERDRIRRQEVEDDRKIHAQLDQMREAFRKEENPNEDVSNFRSTSQLSGQKAAQARDYSGERPGSNLNLLPVAPPSNYQDVNHNVPLREPYRSPSPYDQNSFGQQVSPTSYNQSVSDQLAKLQRVQDEIDAKNNLDRLETDKIFRDLLDSNRRLQGGVRGDMAFDSRKLPSSIRVSPANVGYQTNVQEQMSGNIRLESHFTRIQQTPAIAAGSYSSAVGSIGDGLREVESAGPTTETEAQPVGTLSSNMAATLDNRSAINRLEDLIDDFQKPEERLEER